MRKVAERSHVELPLLLKKTNKSNGSKKPDRESEVTWTLSFQGARDAGN